jgi:hypothetical protein
VITSVFSYGAVGLLAIRSPMVLGVAYLLLALLSGVAFALFQRARAGAFARSGVATEARSGVAAETRPNVAAAEGSVSGAAMEEAAA